MQDWEDRLTWDDILEMEAQGCDMKDIKERFLARQEAEKVLSEQFEKYSNALRFTMDEVDNENIGNKTDILKIEHLINECRNPESQIVKDTIGKPPFLGLLGKDKWINDVKSSDVLYASVIQCHPQLWEQVTEDITPASYLMVYSLNPQYSRNVEVLKKVSKLLNDFRDREDIELSNYSASMQNLYKELDDPQSAPHILLDTTLLREIGIEEPNADIRVTNGYIYDDTPLPNKKLPSDGILPFIRFKEQNFGVDISFSYATRLIPGNYYQA